MAKQETYVPFEGKYVIEDDEPLNVAEKGASLSGREVGGSSRTFFEQESWNPPSPTPSKEHV